MSVPDKPLDVLAQQIVAETSAEENGTRTRCSPFKAAYRNLEKTAFMKSWRCWRAAMPPGAAGAALLHHDALNKLRARKGSA